MDKRRANSYCDLAGDQRDHGETRDMPEKTEPVEPEEGSAQMELTERREETDLPGVDLIPPDKISVFNSLHQQFVK
ncbi:MAG: hypothetical protein GY696_33640 [Gammaproteobacteria bacterium]|nr:hypothetical protein [Gammaproteobacteria bacterium]